MQKIKILIADDEDFWRREIRTTLTEKPELFDGLVLEVTETDDPDKALSLVSTFKPDIALVDCYFHKKERGVDLIESCKKVSRDLFIIMLSVENNPDIARRAIDRGAFDYLLKSNFEEQLVMKIRIIARLIERLRQQEPAGRLVGESQKMADLRNDIQNAANAGGNILVLGESGTGKELVYNEVLRLGKRQGKPVLKVNITNVPENLVEGTLFGIEPKFVSSGPDKEPKIGLFEKYHTGVLVLDEIGDLSLDLQVKLNRVLQFGTFQRVGGTEEIKVDVQVISGTRCDLDDMMQKGKFRDDLYWRLRMGGCVRIPPLRERKEDIPLLVEHFLRREGRDLSFFSDDAVAALGQMEWGRNNVRELECFTGYAVNWSGGMGIDAKFLNSLAEKFYGRTPSPQTGPGGLNISRIRDTGCAKDDKLGDLMQTDMDLVKKQYIEVALKMSGGNKVKAAEMLGVSRDTLYRGM